MVVAVMLHKHHIVPKYMGGSDDPDNLVELTVQEHADAHNLLYCLHGNIEDKNAEQLLLGWITHEEFILKGRSAAGRKGGSKRSPKQLTHISKLGKSTPGRSDIGSEAVRTGQIYDLHKRISCVHCGKTGIISNINRWHDDNCKYRESQDG